MSHALLPGAIYAALYWRPDGKYHWAIVIVDSLTSGRKLHATNLEGPAWRYARDNFGAATEQKPPVILAQIGGFVMKLFGGIYPPLVLASIGNAESSSGSASIDSLLSDIPLATPECDASHPFTCRIWFREAVRVLTVHGAGVCPSVDALEKELTGLADANGDSVASGKPWTLHDDLHSVHVHL